MKIEKIQELFDKYTLELTYSDNTMRVMNIEDFEPAINQAELEWYKKLENHLSQMIERENFAYDVRFYCEGVQNKIKELENEND